MKRVVLIILSVLVLLVAVPMLLGGALFAAWGSGDDPTVEGRIGQVDSSGYAVVSDTLDVDWDYPLAERFDITIGVRGASTDAAVFLGYGPTADVDAYLSGVAQTLVHSIGDASRADRDVEVPGSVTPEPPGEQDFWLQSASGTGLQEIPLASQTGSFRLVVMNADASAGVNVDVYGSMSLPFLLPLGIGMLLFGLLLLALGIVLLVWGIRSKPTPAATPGGPGVPPGYAPQGYGAQGYTPQGYAPQGYGAQGYGAQGDQAQGSAPKGNEAQGSAPQEDWPRASTYRSPPPEQYSPPDPAVPGDPVGPREPGAAPDPAPPTNPAAPPDPADPPDQDADPSGPRTPGSG